VTARVAVSPLAYVTAGREAIGHIIARGKLGFEAFDREQNSLGVYATQREAAAGIILAHKKCPARSGANLRNLNSAESTKVTS
jgi:hypothetical protein